MEKKPFGTGQVNNEVDFCRVYDLETKKKIEKILLDNRISYCCHFEDKGLLQKVFNKSGQNSACIFRIHDEEVPRARKLVRSVLGESNKKKRKDTKK